MSGVWAFLGGVAGILRMVAAAALASGLLALYFLWAVIPDREEAARSGYVLLSRATTAEAEAATLKNQIKAQGVVIDAYQVQYKNALEKNSLEDLEAEARNAEHEAQAKAAGVVDDLSVDEFDYIMRQRQARKAARSGR